MKLDIIKIFQKILKGTELNRWKKYGDKLDEIVQLATTSIIISHTHAQLQLCIVAPNRVTITGDHNY